MVSPRTPPIFTSPQDAALAFYHAFEARDLEAMMATWADDEDIVCVHPGGARYVGYDAVRAGFEHLFAAGARLHFRLEQIVMVETVGLALQSAVEQLHTGDDGARGTAIVSNVLLRTPSGWRLVCHHASPAPAIADLPQTGPLH